MNPLYLTILFAVLLCLLRGAVVAIDEVGSSLQAEQSNPEASSVQSNAGEIDIEVNEEDEIEVSEMKVIPLKLLDPNERLFLTWAMEKGWMRGLTA